MRSVRRTLKWICLILGIVIIGLIITYLVFYLQGKSFLVQIPYFGSIIRIGKIPQSSYPKSIDASFRKVVVQNTKIWRAPLYEDDMIVDQWDDGKLYAHDVRSGEKKLYVWTDETAYICVDTRRLDIITDDPNFKKPDPKETLANFKFFFWDDGLRGDMDASGFFHFEADVEPDLPAKLILQNRTPDENGGYWLLNIFLFVNKDCAEFEV